MVASLLPLPWLLICWPLSVAGVMPFLSYPANVIPFLWAVLVALRFVGLPVKEKAKAKPLDTVPRALPLPDLL